MPTFEIPLNPTPETFSLTLSNVQYDGTTRWNVAQQVWTLSLATVDGVRVIDGVPLIAGVNLLEQYTNLGFTGKLYAVVDHDSNANPSFTNLGSTGHLYYVGP